MLPKVLKNKALLLTLLLLQLLIYLTPPKLFATSTWQITTKLPYQLASHTVITNENKIIVINGSANFMSSKHSVLSNNLNQNGSLSDWLDEAKDTPEALIWHITTTNGSLAYILGGKEENIGSAMSHVNTVYVSKINNGQIDSWTTTTKLPQSLSLGNAFIRSNKIFYLGGMREAGGNIYNQKIYASSINSADGSIGVWTDAGNLPAPLSGFGLFLNGNHLIIVGGENSSGKSDKVYTATIQPDGTIGSWQETSSLPSALSRAQFTQHNSTIFSIGGVKNDGSTSDDVYYTQIKSDGTIEPWKTSINKIPQPTCCGSALLSNNYIYLIGGHNTGTGEYYDEVFFTKPEEITDNGGSQTLPVPYFSQNTFPWGDKEYDHAKSLRFTDTTFERWGCAVTSAAMIMRYHNINVLPNGTPIDPGSLNNWLKNNNGYLTGKDKEGSYSYLSFPAISTLSKKIFDADKSRFKLEYYREKPTTNNLDTFLNINKHPVILKVSNNSTSSHFVVAKGKTTSSYEINDPEWNYPSLNNFNNTFTQIDRFVPAHSNLSYIVIVVNPKTHLLITNPQGKKTGSSIVNRQIITFDEIPNASYSYQSPINNTDSRGRNASMGTGVNEFLLPKPENGRYLIEASSLEDRRYEMNISTFQENGNNKLEIIKDITNSRENIALDFNQNKSPKIRKVKVCKKRYDKSTSSKNNSYSVTDGQNSNQNHNNHDDHCED